MSIPDVVVVASCSNGRPWTDSVEMTIRDADRPRPRIDLIDQLRRERVPRMLAEAREHGVTISDDPCVDLVGASVRLDRDQRSGQRRRIFELVAAEGSYFDFLVSSAALDEAFSASDGSQSTLRQMWRSDPTTIEDVAKLPAIAKVGVGTAVVTADNKLVLGARGRTFIAGRRSDRGSRTNVHVVAEGMIPGDRNHRGLLDPQETARRGLQEELNIGDDRSHHARVDEIVNTGFFFDQQRWQPCFAFLARINITWDELQTVAPAARDFWEVERLIAVDFDVASADITYLLTGTHPDLALASNHAAAVVWFSLLYQHGVTHMRDALTRPGAVYRPAA